MNTYIQKAPFGWLILYATDQTLIKIDLKHHTDQDIPDGNSPPIQWSEPFEAYFEDAAQSPVLPIQPTGTAFQRSVWQQISQIRTGDHATYGEIASSLKSSPRAVGQACGANPYPLIVPCHRVVSSTGIGGFAHQRQGGQLMIKQWLLDHERPN